MTEESGFIKTTTNNFVSRSCIIQSPNNVELRGKNVFHKGVEVRGDLARIRAGRYCTVHEETVLSPPPFEERHIPLVMGSHVVIGRSCHIQAAAIGSNVLIADNVTLGQRCIIRDNCIIEQNSLVPDDTVIPPFSRVSGKPATVTEELPEACTVLLLEQATQQYKDFCDTQRD